MSYERDDDHLKDTIDLISHAAHERKEYEDDHGGIQTKLEMDPDTLFWGTRMVNTQYLGQAVVAFKRLEEKANECKNFMTSRRAEIAAGNLMARYKQYKYGVVSKSSETVRDKHNNQASFIHLIRKQTIEREFNTKDEKTRKLLSGWLGNTSPDDS